jgi:3-carboxy-cis,cis-muconate cycloisomerase
VQACGSALASAADVVQGLEVKPDRMRANLTSTAGVIFAERLTFILSTHVGRETANRLATSAVATSQSSGRRFSEVVASMPEIARHLTSDQLNTLDTPEAYLGAAEAFRQRLIAAARASLR